ncbi:hypothetical protein SAMN04488023_104210 [Pedobacter rhizosphaerae]|uniref:Tetratricopeptide repeat-containing protein n=1 Tax=Pedobacter rhizosphaerae TaxID=390241 RepID=A0A1H9LNW1_9SPHI|nr:hypothetical protein SAMN04488023_104210 [Pedobacter rhizosphaerae]
MLYNRYGVAIKDFAKIFGLYPFVYHGNGMLGCDLQFSGRISDAKACFERALLIKAGNKSSADGLNQEAKYPPFVFYGTFEKTIHLLVGFRFI